MNEALEEKEVHLRDYLIVLHRRRYVVIISFLAIFLFTVIFSLFRTPVYEAETTIYLEEGSKSGGFLGDIGLLGPGSTIGAEIEVIKSRSIAEKVVGDLGLDVRIDDDPYPSLFSMMIFGKGYTAGGVEGRRIKSIYIHPDGYYEIFQLKLSPVYREKELYIEFVNNEGGFVVKDKKGNEIARGESGKPLEENGISLILVNSSTPKGHRVKLKKVDFTEAAEGIQKRIKVQKMGDRTPGPSTVLKIAYQDADPVRAMHVANAIARAYQEKRIERRSKEAQQTESFLAEQLERVRESLGTSEKRLGEFKTKEGIVELSKSAESLVERIAELEKDRVLISLDLRSARNLYRRLIESQGSNKEFILSTAASPDPIIGQLAQTLSQLEVKRQAMLQEFTERHPEVAAIDSQIKELKNRILLTVKNSIDGLEKRQETIENAIKENESNLKKLPGAERELAIMTRSFRTNEEIYLLLLKKYEEARIARAATVANMDIVDPAILPLFPVKPRLKINLPLGATVGLMFGCFLAFFLEYLDDSIKDEEDVKNAVNLPIFATIPHDSAHDGKKSLFLPGREQRRERRLISLDDRKSVVAEAYRSFRTNIQFTGIDKSAKSYLITSPGSGEGKSTITANLGIVLSSLGSRVLIVDADLRKGRLHEIFKLNNSQGLSIVLSSDIRWDEVVKETQHDGLFLLPSGPYPPNPSELLASRRMKEFMSLARERFDYVLYDSPPVILVSDACIIGTSVDGIFIVARAGTTGRNALRKAREILPSPPYNVYGVILNDMEFVRSRYYGYYGYGYYYYGEEDGKKDLISRIRKKLSKRHQ